MFSRPLDPRAGNEWTCLGEVNKLDLVLDRSTPTDENVSMDDEPIKVHTTFRVLDCNGDEIKVGSRIDSGDPDIPHGGEVMSISEPEQDVDDEGRTKGIPPHIEVHWDIEPPEYTETFLTYFTGSHYDDDLDFKSDDLMLEKT